MSEKTPIQSFYKDQGIFITGASGFLGTALLEKLIRACPDVKKIYILLRSKRDKTVEQRLDEIFDNHVWDKVCEQNPNYKNYVQIIEGELMSPKLGISDENYTKLKNEVNIIFHVAATVRFDEPLKRAVKINIEATKKVLELAKECNKLKAVVHVSTAFSQCIYPTLKEIFYPPQRDPEEFLAYCEQHTEEELNEQTPSIIGNYPNTYTFTKGLAENLIKKYGNELPIGLCRPSIVFGCAEGPIKGWAKGIYGPTGAMIAMGAGVLHVMPSELDVNADIIPADMCVNQMIAVAYETAKNPKKATIYNCVTGSENPITWREYWHWSVSFAFAYACTQSIWYYFLFFSSNKKHLEMYNFLFHTIPAHILDTLLRLTGKEPRLVKVYQKVHKMTRLLTPFCTTPWIFYSDNAINLFDHLDPRDQNLFPFDVRKIVWDKYLLSVIRYARINILQEPINNVVVAQKKMLRFKIAHYSLIFVFVIIFYWILSRIFKLFI